MGQGKIVGSAPILLTTNVEAALEYYQQKLGFAVRSRWGSPNFFAILDRDGFSLCLSRVDHQRHIVPHYKVVPGMWNAYFWVDDVDSLYQEFQASGAIIDYELSIKEYGVKEFGVQDLDGYDIAFGQILKT